MEYKVVIPSSSDSEGFHLEDISSPSPEVPQHYCFQDTCATVVEVYEFCEKLWEVIENDRFKSVWWGDNGNCIVIAEDLFQKEVLGRKGLLKIFDSETVGDFILHLYCHGFCRLQSHYPITISIKQLQAVASAEPAQLHFFYNSFFNQNYVDFLSICCK